MVDFVERVFDSHYEMSISATTICCRNFSWLLISRKLFLLAYPTNRYATNTVMATIIPLKPYLLSHFYKFSLCPVKSSKSTLKILVSFMISSIFGSVLERSQELIQACVISILSANCCCVIFLFFLMIFKFFIKSLPLTKYNKMLYYRYNATSVVSLPNGGFLMLIDWLQFTIHNGSIDSNTSYGCVADYVLDYLPYSIAQFIVANTSNDSQSLYLSIGGAINLYRKSFTYINGVRVCFDGVSESMGVNVLISGSILRNCNITSDDIKLWWERFRNNPDVSLSRVDIAYDTVSVDFPVFLQSYLLKEFISKPHKNSVCLNSNQRGTIYFGSRGSRVHIRIYDKRQEQLDKNYHDKKKLSELLVNLPDVWTRVEFQFRHEICSFVLDRFVEDDFSSYANGFLRFVDIPANCTNISRDAPIKAWWSDLLGADDIDILYYRKESSFNYEAFVKNVVPQIKAILSVNPDIYKKALSEGSLSTRTLDNLQKDEILGNNYF